MNYVVLDVETKKLFDEVPGRNHALLGVSFVGIYDSSKDIYEGFYEDEIGKLWPILEQTDLVIGYNIKGFDWPVLNAYYSGNLSKLPTLDLLELIYNSLGFRLRLDDVAKATLGVGKTGSGLDAYRFFKEGKLDLLKDYCLNDVKVTRGVYEYALQNGHVKYPDLGGVTKEIKLAISDHLSTIKKDDHQMTLI
jgi:DEAD/DEAH box helicase domain-containing protein